MADPQLTALKTYLKLGAPAPWEDAELEAALVAERSAQKARRDVPESDVPADLTEALFRRVARNLALRGLPLGVQPVVTEVAVAVFRLGDDAEIKRLEAPYPKLTVG